MNNKHPPPTPESLLLPAASQALLMNAALDSAREALTNGEIPIGAAVGRLTADGIDVLASAHNSNIAKQRRIAHAEMLALDAASDALLRRGERAAQGNLTAVLDVGVTILASTVAPCIIRHDLSLYELVPIYAVCM